jgi:hypothetical protein
MRSNDGTTKWWRGWTPDTAFVECPLRPDAKRRRATSPNGGGLGKAEP